MRELPSAQEILNLFRGTRSEPSACASWWLSWLCARAKRAS